MEITSNMSGIVARVLVELGTSVQPGETVVVLESMKMEIAVVAGQSGVVKEIRVNEGDFVEEGAPLVVLDELPPTS
jgi:acetyl-CoA carboxylase biotin carboxyl carrier protein